MYSKKAIIEKLMFRCYYKCHSYKKEMRKNEDEREDRRIG